MRGVAVVVGAIVLVGVAACSSGPKSNGEDKKTATAVVGDAKAALKQAKTVHISGTQTQTANGTKTSTAVDLHFLNGTGSSQSISSGGQTIQVLRVGNDLYVKGGANLFGAAEAKVVGDHYVKLSATSGTGEELGDGTMLSDAADALMTTDGKLVKEPGTATVAGKKAVVLTDTTSDGTLKFYIASTGSPVPLQIVESGTIAGTLTFGDYGVPVTLAAPAGAVTIPGA